MARQRIDLLSLLKMFMTAVTMVSLFGRDATSTVAAGMSEAIGRSSHADEAWNIFKSSPSKWSRALCRFLQVQTAALQKRVL